MISDVKKLASIFDILFLTLFPLVAIVVMAGCRPTPSIEIAQIAQVEEPLEKSTRPLPTVTLIPTATSTNVAEEVSESTADATQGFYLPLAAAEDESVSLAEQETSLEDSSPVAPQQRGQTAGYPDPNLDLLSTDEALIDQDENNADDQNRLPTEPELSPTRTRVTPESNVVASESASTAEAQAQNQGSIQNDDVADRSAPIAENETDPVEVIGEEAAVEASPTLALANSTNDIESEAPTVSPSPTLSPTPTSIPPTPTPTATYPPPAPIPTAIPTAAPPQPTSLPSPTVEAAQDFASASINTAPTASAWGGPFIQAGDIATVPADTQVIASEVGIQLHLHSEDLQSMLGKLDELNVGWVKLQVAWKTFEPRPGEYDENWFGELDYFIHLASGRDIKILLSVAKAPEWSRPTTEMDGPPSDFAHFERFMRDLTQRYKGNVHAYELWNEPNLMREWHGMTLSPEQFVDLVAVGARGVRASDPDVFIISGAPATTGINDGQNAIDDRVYFERMLAAGVANHVDGIGVHPYGWGNPPDAVMGQPVAGVISHNDHPSFFFAHTMADYINLMSRYQVYKPMWLTEFGWGSFEKFERQPPEDAVFMLQVSEEQQADYLETALEIGAHQPQIGPMFLWNLNFGPLLGEKFSESGYSILRPDDSKRPAYQRLKELLEGQ